MSNVLIFPVFCNKCKREMPDETMYYNHPKIGFVCEYCPEFNDGYIAVTDEEIPDDKE